MNKPIQKYTFEELDKIHKLETECLKDFARICKKYNLGYFLTAGAALGAVRHKGPIPWDDDIDVGMLRDDYEKFLSIAQQELGDKYNIHTPTLTKDYPIFVINLSRRGTVFQREIYKKLSYMPGIGLDVFPFDYVCENEKQRKKHIRKAWFWNKLLILKNMSSPQVPGKGIKKKLILLACGCIHGILKLPFPSRNYIISKFYKTATRYNNATPLVTSFSETYPEKIKLRVDDIFPLAELDYMDIKVFLPHNYDKFLTNEYGDYMTIPSVQDRKSNRPYRLNFLDE